MDSLPIALYVDLAVDAQTPVWLRIGEGALQPDGSILARIDHLPSRGPVRFHETTLPGLRGPGRSAGPPPLAGARRVPVGVRSIPPFPARRWDDPGRHGGIP